MHSDRQNSSLAIGIILILGVIGLLTIPVSSQAAPDTSLQVLISHAWELAQQSERYNFTTRLVQTTHPAPSLANVGRGPRVETAFLDGQTDLEADLLSMRIWQDGGRISEPGQAAEIRVEDGKTYGRQGGGAWQEIDNFTESLTPGNDASAFLVAARNVEQVSPNLPLSHFTFDISGPALAEHLRGHLEAQLRAAGKLPPGLYLDAPEQFRNAIGDGEVWLDEMGLPQRLSIHMQYPQQANGERLEIEMQTDFSNFDRSALTDLQSPAARFRSSVLGLLTKAQKTETLISLSVLGLLSLVLFNSYSKKIYAAIVIAVILSMLLTPLLQSAQVYAFEQEQAAQKTENDRQQAEQEAAQEIQTVLNGDIWNPHSQPVDQIEENNNQWEIDHPGLLSPVTGLQAVSLQSNTASDASDDDGDGLTGDDDPCPDNADCDSDGLLDGQEVRLGTDPEEKDTDGDYITDNAEVAGFWYNNQWWYSNPSNPDTNNDGLNDGSECSEKAVDEDELSPEENACEDRDSDGTPDIFDRDNDDDGVPDRVDLSPDRLAFQENGDPFDGQNPLKIQVDALHSDLPVFLDFQIRPVDEDHIWYALNVLDWPSGDEAGQVMRKSGNNSTFEDVDDPAANAANGDMRLVPMLEIEIPFKEGHYANLPVLDGAPPRTQDAELDDWLDREALSDYGISVRPANDDGDLVAYVPLNLVEDETGGNRVAFGGRMFYWPSNTITETETTDWGNTQQVRVVWLVQMLADYVCSAQQDEDGECTEGEWVTDTPQVVRGYDESWYLTGLSVREDHGLEVAIAYEDPAEEPSEEKRQYDDWLWALAHGLDQTFLTGRDENEDGQRDITIGEIHARFDNRVNSSTSDDERWGIPITATQVITFAYAHEDYFVHVMLTETQKILTDTFSTYRDQGADAPTLLFAQEAQYRTVNLGDGNQVAQDGNLLRIDVDPEAVRQHTRTFVSWAPYRYNADEDRWENYPIDEYMDKMEVRLKDAFDEYKDEPDYENILRGQILLAQAHYLSFFAGVMHIVQVGDTLTGEWGQEYRDDEMAEWINAVDFDKAGGIISRQTYTFANTIAKIAKYYKDTEKIFSDLGTTFQGSFKATIKNLWQNASWKKLKLGAAIAGAVIAAGVLITALALYGEGNGRAAILTLDAVMLKVAVLDVLYTLRSIVKAFKASEAVGKWAKFKDAMKTKGMKYSGKAFAIGTIVAAVVMLAAFLIAWGVSGERWDSLDFTLGLASVLSSIITMVILMAIAAIPIVGQIIATVIFLLDVIFQIVCHAQDRAEDDFYCQGISGYVSQGVRWTIFSQNIMVKMDKKEFLRITDFEQDFRNLEAGMSVGNTLIVTVDTRHQIQTLPKNEMSGWMPYLYRWQYSDNNTKSTTFSPHLDSSAKDYHRDLDRGDVSSDWDKDGSYFNLDQSASASVSLTRSGINQPARLYLNDGYALPAQECWLLPNPLWLLVPIPVCYVRTYRDSINVNLGQNMAYDVFPATFDEFIELTTKGGGYALAWSQDTSPAFPRLKDADGDGLRNKIDGGADPNDLLWDSDLDHLSDFYEHESGSDPLDVDSDDDGLSDYEEALLETDPNRADTDYDGLTDKEEVDGWEFVYDFAVDGSQLATWVTSDPLSIDEDGDTFSDFQEKTYGFHPRVESDPNILTLESQVSESLAPHLLLRLDETSGATAFSDDSGYINNLACLGTHCPVAGHYGKYGNGPQFDGLDDYLEVSHKETLSPDTELTLSAWVYLNNSNADQKIIGKTSTNDGFVLGVENGQLYPEIWDSQGAHFSAHWGSIPTETWTHLALTWQSGGQMVGYVNGEVVGSIAASSHPIGENNLPLRIGIAPWNASAWPVEGRIDEVLLFPQALSESEIQAQAAGRYNPEDLTVQSGDELFYEASVTNELFNRYAQGLLSTHFPAAFTELPPQDFVLNPQESAVLSGTVTVASAPSGVYTLTQEADALITDWREDSGYAEARYRFSDTDTLLEDSSGSQPPRDGECDSSHCPTLAAGRYGNGAQFDGTDDYVTANAVAEALTGPALSFGGWVYPETGMSLNGVMLSFHTASGGNRLMLEYDPAAEKFIAYEKNIGDVYSANTFAPDQWYHVMYVIYEGSGENAYLYVNGVEEAHFQSVARPDGDGRFSLGQEWDGDTPSNFFLGRLDEIGVYPRALSEAEIQELFNNPILHVPFDEGVRADSFEDDSGFGNAATCSGADCPQSGVGGISRNAVQFDGQEHLAVSDSSALYLSSSDFTLSAWVYPEGNTSISDCPFRTEYFTNKQLSSNNDTVRKCENYPLNHDWGNGGPFSGYPTNYFSARWTGTFFFAEGTHTFTFVTDDGMRAWLDSDQLLNEWHTQSETTYHVDRSVSAGWHTVKVEYFEQTGDATAKVSWSPGPLPHPQGIFGAEDYPAIQRAGNYLRLVLNPDTAFLTDSEVLTPQAWNHVAASFDGSTWFLYVNGVEVDQFNVSGQTPEPGQGFEIGRANTIAQLDLQSLSVLDGGDSNQGGDANLEIRIQVQADGSGWDTVWSNDTVWVQDDYSLDVQTTFQDQAEIKIYESDQNEYWNCSWLNPCDGEDPEDEQMGTISLSATDPSPYESVTGFESNKGDDADLLWYSQIDSVPFKGKIDEVAIYKIALSADQVGDLYDAGTLVLRLPLNDAPGASDFADALGQHNGSCSGETCPTAGVPGREEMALLFDGLDDYVTVNEASTADLDKLTLAAWVHPNSTPAGTMRFITVGDEKAVLRYENGDLDFYVTTLGVPNPVIQHLRFTPEWQAGYWYHVAATYDRNTMRLYLNGAEVASQSASGELVGDANIVRLSHPTESLDGALDEIRLYRRALDAAEIQALYKAAPEMLLLLDEDGQTATFSDATGNGHNAACSGNSCPDAGTKGQMGLAALFDGENDYLEIPHSAALTPSTEMTLIAWVRLEDTDPDQKLIGKSTIGDGYILGVHDGQLYPEIWDSSGTRFSNQWGQITAGYWTQVAITWESGGDLIGYINGQEVGRMAASANPIGNNNSSLRVGVAPWTGYDYPVNGRLDQVTLYTRALSPLEMRELFRLQAKWVEDRQHTEITIDSEAPNSTLVSDETYRPNQEVMLLVKASDATTFVTLVEMGLSLDNGASYTWQSVPACDDSRNGTAWCPTFEPSIGEGRYLLQFRATDNVGNREIPGEIYTILVDDTPPQADTDIPEGQTVRAELQPDNSWLLPLSGTVADPQIAGSAGSGVAEVTIKLTDTDPVTDTLPLLTADFGGGLWQADYPLLEADATGTYELSIKTTDQMGNGTELLQLITLGVDTAPPHASLNDITAQTGLTGTITTTLQIGGLITETNEIITGINELQLSIIPAAMESFSGTVAIFHFEEPTGSARFGNRAGLGGATCEAASCPVAGHPGIWGTGLNFNFDGNYEAADDYISADSITAAFTDTQGLSFGAWVYPRYNPGNRAILAFNTADGGNRNQLVHNDYTLRYLDDDINIEIGYAWNAWTFVMITIDADGNGAAYLDGELQATFNTSVRPDPLGRFSIGQEWDGENPSQFFNGLIDEVRVYNRALAPNEVAGLYTSAALDASGSDVAETDWHYNIPEGLDGLYQINIKPGDIYSNSAPGNQWSVWNGQIDTRGPEVKLTILEETGEITDLVGLPIFNVATTYTCWAQDFNLRVDQFDCPCQTLAPASTVISNTFYHEVSPWYAEVFTDTAHLWEYQETCTVPGLATNNFMEACDSFGRCSTDVADVDQLVEEIAVAYSVVITPAHQTVLTSTGTIDIKGRAYARDRIQQVNLYDGVSPIGTFPVDISCSGNITTTQWTQSWFAAEGNHNLRAQVVPCTGNTSDSLVNQLDVDSLPPLVGILPTAINRDQRLSYGRVRLSGPATDATSGLASVEVSVDGSDWAKASFGESTWQWDWYLGEEPDNTTYNVAVRATDRAGWSVQTNEAIIVDLDVPNPVTLTLTSDVTADDVVTTGLTLRQAPATFDLSWEASEPSSELSHYEVVWTAQTPAIPVLPVGPLTSQYVAGEAQRIAPQVTSVFLDGNIQVDNWGPVYIDTPLTPDYVSMVEDGFGGPYHDWMDSGCSNLGVDRRVQEKAPDGISLADPQNLYATWDTGGLRLAWVGANWDYDGDLFIYLNDLTDPSVPLTAYNPFTDTQETTLNIPGGKAFIWIENQQTANLFLWNGSSFENIRLTPAQYRFSPGLNGGTTDLYIPFDLLGITDPALTPLTMFAFATDEGQMRLWATQPAQNPVNSPNVVETDIYAGIQQTLEWLHVYAWPSLGPGICPNAPSLFQVYTDADLRFGISTQPDGTAYGLQSSDLFWLADQLTSLTRTVDLSQQFSFMDVDHLPVGNDEVLSYTLNFANHGAYTATDVTVQAVGLYALEFTGEVDESITITIGDIPPGAAGSVTFYGYVDTNGPYNECLSQTGGDTIACQPYRDWAVLSAIVSDSAYGSWGNPLDWLWVDHQVDTQGPEFFGILEPEALIRAGVNTLSGYAFDASGVSAVTLDVQPPSGGSYQTQCLDDAPFDGIWSCGWDAGAALDGAVFQVRLQAQDRYGNISDWSMPYAFTVDTSPPTVSLSAATQAYSTTIVNRTAASFSGSAADNHALDWQEVCVGGVCRAANSLMTQDTNSVYADEPGAALSIGACGGGELVRSFDVAENFTLRSVSLGFSADHTRRDDLLITLTSPASTVVQVIGPPAGSGSDYANLDVSLDDANFNSQHTYKGDDDAGEPYFDRQTRPVEPLEAFRGEESAGNWTLTVCDLNPDENEGSYNRAQLSLQPQNQAITAADWNYTQTGLEDQDYISHTLEAYAYDLVGNISDVAALTFWVDNVAPVLNVTETVPLAATGFAPEPIRLLGGTVSDGGKVQQLYALALSPSGKRLSLQVGRNDGSWWFDLTSQETGEYSLWINAIDAAGNAVSAGPFTATIVRVLAENDGPTALGTTTTFTATVLGDDANTYSFDWDFGDGAAASGQPSAVSHLYAGVDVYTATVTANKGSDIFTATTTVTVDEAINGLTAANDSPAFYGETTVLTATISAGSNATYAWNFGDGQPSAMTNEAATLHNYAAGVYTATVTALNSVSVVTATTQVQIVDLIAVNDSPTMAGQTTIFTATLLGDETSSYAWDFGDGMMDSNPSAMISHTYELPDIYSATVWVDSAAGWITATTMVTVNGLGVINNSPTSLGVPTIFTATTSLTGTVSFGWDFGDGTSPLNDASAAISHTYAAAGAYTAVVTASNTTEVLTATSIVVIDGETPNIAINDPVSGQVIKTTSYSLRGTAADDVALAWVEISTDGGQTWQRASGDENWAYVWNVPLEDRVTHTLLARAADEVGHITVSEPVVVTVSTKKPFWLYLPLIIR